MYDIYILDAIAKSQVTTTKVVNIPNWKKCIPHSSARKHFYDALVANKISFTTFHRPCQEEQLYQVYPAFTVMDTFIIILAQQG